MNTCRINKHKKGLNILLNIAFSIYSIVTYVLIYKMLSGEIESDYYLHRVQSFEGRMGYSLNGYLFTFLYSIGGNWLTALFFSLVICATPIMLFILFNMFDVLFETCTSDTLKKVGAFIGCTATPIYIPYFFEHFAMGHIPMNPWHNSTFTTMKFFAIIALIFYVKIIVRYKRGENMFSVEYLFYGIFLFLSSWSKPSFALAFLPIIGLSIVVDFLLNIKDIDVLKGRLYLGLASIPAGLVIVGQWILTYNTVDKGGNSLAFGFSPAFFTSTPKVIAKLALTFIVPFVVYFITFYRNEKRISIQIWSNCILNMLIAMFVYESGDRMYHGNLKWGMSMGVFMLFIYSIYHIIAKVADLTSDVCESAISITMTVVAVFTMLYQGFTGMLYVLALFVSKIETWSL